MDSKSFIPASPTNSWSQSRRQADRQCRFPRRFRHQGIAGQKGVYDVEVVEVKEKVLPAMDDAFAKSFGAENAEKLREGVRRDLENELNYSQNAASATSSLAH